MGGGEILRMILADSKNYIQSKDKNGTVAGPVAKDGNFKPPR